MKQFIVTVILAAGIVMNLATTTFAQRKDDLVMLELQLCEQRLKGSDQQMLKMVLKNQMLARQIEKLEAEVEELTTGGWGE